MIITIVDVWVKPAHIEDFKEAILKNVEGSLLEPGNVRFDLLQDSEDPAKFTLYEVFRTEEDIQAHKETEHYLTWRATVQDWMAKPRKGTRYNLIAPTEEELW